ncbi:MAG: molybdopterin cofactor-binding domain-containing protein [Magnetovibrionaceae bacterium]
MNEIMHPTRRAVLKSTAAAASGLVGGLVVGFQFGHARAAESGGPAPVDPNAFIQITPDNKVVVTIKHLEMGQGTYTGLATIIAEELDADWTTVEAVSAPADASRYNNLHWGPYQGTGGSSAIANSWPQLREAGAKARAMVIQAAAKSWGVSAKDININDSVVSHPSGKSATLGELAERAGAETAPLSVTPKDPSQFKLIGKVAPRLDSASKSNGTAEFAIDVQRPDLASAVIKRSPRFGGTVADFNADAAQAMPGVIAVFEVPNGVAVVAETHWQAFQARDRLEVTWDETNANTKSSAEILGDYKALAETAGQPFAGKGDIVAGLKAAKKTVSATYEFPFLAHAPMEPLTAVAELKDGACELWLGCQLQTLDQALVAHTVGLEPAQVKINTTLAGGSFGRRATPSSDFATEVASVAKGLKDLGLERPVKLIWTREDDIQGGRYRPAYVHKIEAGIGDDGLPIAWKHRIVGQSILKGTPFEGFLVKDGIDMTSVEGVSDMPYAVPNFAGDLHTTNLAVPVLWWRSVGHTHTAYAVETMIDELATAAGADPVDYRLKLLGGHPREQGVLKLAAEKAGWKSGDKQPKGKGRGVAVHKSFNSYVAMVVDVTMDADRAAGVTVDKVTIACDCGIVVNPDNVVAQMEGGMGFGLAAALHQAVDLEEGGTVSQSNFHDYEIMRIDEMPEVEVHLVASAEAPTGVGEPGTPPIAPALANAIADATGKRVRGLPLSRTLKA